MHKRTLRANLAFSRSVNTPIKLINVSYVELRIPNCYQRFQLFDTLGQGWLGNMTFGCRCRESFAFQNSQKMANLFVVNIFHVLFSIRLPESQTHICNSDWQASDSLVSHRIGEYTMIMNYCCPIEFMRIEVVCNRG